MSKMVYNREIEMMEKEMMETRKNIKDITVIKKYLA